MRLFVEEKRLDRLDNETTRNETSVQQEAVTDTVCHLRSFTGTWATMGNNEPPRRRSPHLKCCSLAWIELQVIGIYKRFVVKWRIDVNGRSLLAVINRQELERSVEIIP